MDCWGWQGAAARAVVGNHPCDPQLVLWCLKLLKLLFGQGASGTGPGLQPDKEHPAVLQNVGFRNLFSCPSDVINCLK